MLNLLSYLVNTCLIYVIGDIAIGDIILNIQAQLKLV